MTWIKHYSGILIVVILSVFTLLPLFHAGFFPFHDDAQVQRVFEMKTALSDGMFPVRWVKDLGFGYGYPIFTFYAPFVYYIGGVFNLIGFDALTSTKIMIGIGMLLAGVSMYLFAREFWGRLGAIVSAILYMYAPYHALNLYVRGAVSELWAYGLIPLLFWGIYRIYKSLLSDSETKISKRAIWTWVILTSFSYAVIIITHNLTAMMVTPFALIEALLLFLILGKKKYHFRSALFVALFIGVLIAAFYWLPAIAEMKYTNVASIIGGGSDYKDHFVCLSQLWNSPWGYGGSAPGCVLDGLSFRLGKVHILLALFSVIPLFFTWRKYKKNSYAIFFGLVGALISLFLLLDYSKFLWDMIPQMAYFQFPWRFLVLASFFLSFLGGALFILFPTKLRIVAVAIAVIIIIFINAKLFTPKKTLLFTADHYTNQGFLNWETSKISYEYMPKSFSIPKVKQDVAHKKISFISADAKVLRISTDTQGFTAVISTPHPTIINLAIAYFPAWQVFIDKKPVSYTQFERGLKVKVSTGKHTIQAQYIQTPIELFADIVSLTGVLILLAGIIAFRKEKSNNAKTI